MPETKVDKIISWFKNNKLISLFIVIGIVIIAISTLLGGIKNIKEDLFGKNGLFEPVPDSTNNKSPIDTSQKTKLITPIKQQIITGKPKTITILPMGNYHLQNLFEKDGYYLINKNAHFNIDITFSGDIEEIEKNLYRYNGGKIIIKINGNTCSILSKINISPTFSGGNSKEKVLDEINEKIEKLISENEIDFYNIIKTCIKTS